MVTGIYIRIMNCWFSNSCPLYFNGAWLLHTLKRSSTVCCVVTVVYLRDFCNLALECESRECLLFLFKSWCYQPLTIQWPLFHHLVEKSNVTLLLFPKAGTFAYYFLQFCWEWCDCCVSDVPENVCDPDELAAFIEDGILRSLRYDIILLQWLCQM